MNTKPRPCPACGGHNPQALETLSTRALHQLWMRGYGIDISPLTQKLTSIQWLQCQDCTLGYFDPIVEGDDDFYSKLALDDSYYGHADKNEFDFSLNHIKEGMRVLDIGSGRGVFGELIRKNFTSVQYEGLELNSEAQKQGTQAGLSIHHQTIQDFAPIAKHTYDLICIFQVLEHLTEIPTFMNSVKALLAPGGKIIIAVPNNDSFLKYATNNLLNLPPHHNLLWNEASLKKLGTRFHLKVVEIFREPISQTHTPFYHSVKMNQKITPFSQRPKKVNTRFHYRLSNKVASLINRFFGINQKEAPKNEFGHTIIAVLQSEEVSS